MTTNTQQLRYNGSGGGLFRLSLNNAFLNGLTLGIHSFWGRARVRAFHYNATEMSGERFVYHGTGGELLKGALKAAAVLIPLAIAVEQTPNLVALAPASMAIVAATLASAVYGLIVLVLFAIAVNGSRRYRLSRSSWRGIRFSFDGAARDYVSLVVKTSILDIVSLGFYCPYQQNRLRGFLVNHARLGSQRLQYHADAGELASAYYKAAALMLPTLGLSWLWYQAFRHRYFWGNTGINGARFRSTVTGGALLRLWLTNGLLLFVTFGLGLPWVSVRTMRFWSNHLALHGSVDWTTIEKNAQPAAAKAGAGAEAIGVDADVGLAV